MAWSVPSRAVRSQVNPALFGGGAQDRVDGVGGTYGVCDRGTYRLARGDGGEQSMRLDHLEVVVAEREPGVGLEGAGLAVAGSDEVGGPRGGLVVLLRADPELTHPPEVPRDRALAAVDLEAVGVLLADRRAAGLQ